MNLDPFLSTLVLRLYDVGAVKIDTKVGFKLKLHETNPDASLSPIYVNLRTPKNPKPGPLTPSLVTDIGHALWQHAKSEKIRFDAITGLPNAGTPLARAFEEELEWEQLDVPLIQLGKTEVKGGRKIEGVIDAAGTEPEDTVLVLDDLITAGGSKQEGIEALRKAGFKVTDVLVLVDREQGGSADLEKMGIRLWSLMTLKNIVRLLSDQRKITPVVRDQVLKYLAGEK